MVNDFKLCNLELNRLVRKSFKTLSGQETFDKVWMNPKADWQCVVERHISLDDDALFQHIPATLNKL